MQRKPTTARLWDEVLGMMPEPPRTTDIETLAERLGWPAGRVRLTLIQLRDAGHVTYQPGYRSWARTLRDG